MTKKKQEPSKTYNVYEIAEVEPNRWERTALLLTTNDKGTAKSCVDGSKKPTAYFGAPGEGVYDNLGRLTAPKLKVRAPTVRARRKTTKV